VSNDPYRVGSKCPHLTCTRPLTRVVLLHTMHYTLYYMVATMELYSYCTHYTVLILYSLYCTHTVLTTLYSYCTHTILYSYYKVATMEWL
jgi:hypothetical protein